MYFHASNIHLPTRSKWRTTILSSQYKVTSIQNLRPSRLSTRSKWKKKRSSRLSTRSLQSKIYDPLVSVQGQNEKIKRPSRLSTRSVRIQNLQLSYLSTRSKWRTTTLSSQYKVTSIQNLRPSHLSTRSKWRATTLSSQYKVTSNQKKRPSRLSTRSKWKKKRPTRLSTRSLQSKIYDPLVSIQGQNEKKKRPSRLSTRSVRIQNLQPSYLNTRLV